VKEVHYFDWEHHRGEDWYRSHFATAAPDQKAGEATPGYLWHPEAPARIAALLPDVAMIALLRHPTDRVYSHYWHARSWGAEVPEFDEVVDRALRGGSPWDHLIERGHYAEQLTRYQRALPQPVLVLLQEELAADPAGSFRKICRHLGVTEQEVPGLGKVHNAAHTWRSPRLRKLMDRTDAWSRLPPPVARWLHRANSKPVHYPPMTCETRARLLEHYRPHNARLRQLLCRPLDGWDG
ncbi:MAG: sulfotransferase, partial [Mycobacteriales bacterium]